MVTLKKWGLLGLVAALIAGALPVLAQAPAPYWPTDEWRTSTPEQQGMDSDLLADMLAKIEDQALAIDGVVVTRNGYIVAEAYGPDDHAGTLHVVASVTKSVTSALVGIAVTQGYLDHVDRPVLEFFPDRVFGNVDERKQAMTLEHLLTMTTGLDWPDQKFGMTLAMQRNKDWVQFVLGRPMAEAPGITWLYNNGATHVLSAVLEQVTASSTLDFAEENLFGPLGITSYYWETDRQGTAIGGWGLHMTPRDMAKIGYLYLNDGFWDGEQIINADWIAASVTPHPSVKVDGPLYGYLWWLFTEPDYYSFFAARGMNGQYIIVVPSDGLVVAFTSDLREPDEDIWPLRLLILYILRAVKSDDPLPANPEGEMRLQAAIEALAAY